MLDHFIRRSSAFPNYATCLCIVTVKETQQRNNIEETLQMMPLHNFALQIIKGPNEVLPSNADESGIRRFHAKFRIAHHGTKEDCLWKRVDIHRQGHELQDEISVPNAKPVSGQLRRG